MVINSCPTEKTVGTLVTAADHEFGSQATELKLSVVEAYLQAFTMALRGKFSELWYIDAFAGTGERTERVPARHGGFLGASAPESIVRRRGSAKIAVDIDPPFDRLIFVEQRPRAVEALREMRDQHPGRNIHVIAGDANDEIRKIISYTNWQRIRAVMFLDPYGMSVNWQTLQVIAETRAIDVWYLFSLSGLYRQAARSAAAIDDDKRARLPEFLEQTRGSGNCMLRDRAACSLNRRRCDERQMLERYRIMFEPGSKQSFRPSCRRYPYQLTRNRKCSRSSLRFPTQMTQPSDWRPGSQITFLRPACRPRGALGNADRSPFCLGHPIA